MIAAAQATEMAPRAGGAKRVHLKGGLKHRSLAAGAGEPQKADEGGDHPGKDREESSAPKEIRETERVTTEREHRPRDGRGDERAP